MQQNSGRASPSCCGRRTRCSRGREAPMHRVRLPSPCPPIYSGGRGGTSYLEPWPLVASFSLPNTSSNSIALSEALPEYCSSTNTPLFKPDKFRRRFRMARHVFNRIREGVVAHDPYFECKTDALGKLGFSSYQKCTAATRMLAYGIPGDLVDEYVVGERCRKLKFFLRFHQDPSMSSSKQRV